MVVFLKGGMRVMRLSLFSMTSQIRDYVLFQHWHMEAVDRLM